MKVQYLRRRERSVNFGFAILLILSSVPAWGFDHTHTKFADVLKSRVIRKGNQTLVNYGAIKKDPSKLVEYIRDLAAVKNSEFQSWSKDQKLAALINGYNAWTIKLVVDNYPVPSIKKIGPFYSTPWKQEFIHWLGEKVSLDDIEHGTIRKQFSEPRIHVALVCAALGCPNLQERPFLATELQSQLEHASVEFLRDDQKNRFEISGDETVLNVSSIFNWYGDDFGSKDQLTAYIVQGMGIKDKTIGKKVKMEFLDYDWSLNDAK